ncbi:hypothetical protein D9M71_664480 [compost metagenome]
MVAAVGDEIAGALELERLFGRGGGRGRFDVAGDGAARLGVEVIAVGLAFGLVVRVLHREQAVVQADFGRHGVHGADPVDGALDLAVGAFHAGT